MEATRPVCAEKLKQDEDDLKDFEESYKSNELQESDIYQYGVSTLSNTNDFRIKIKIQLCLLLGLFRLFTSRMENLT